MESPSVISAWPTSRRMLFLSVFPLAEDTPSESRKTQAVRAAAIVKSILVFITVPPYTGNLIINELYHIKFDLSIIFGFLMYGFGFGEINSVTEVPLRKYGQSIKITARTAASPRCLYNSLFLSRPCRGKMLYLRSRQRIGKDAAFMCFP